MKWRRISEQEVKLVLASPEKTEPTVHPMPIFTPADVISKSHSGKLKITFSSLAGWGKNHPRRTRNRTKIVKVVTIHLFVFLRVLRGQQELVFSTTC
jgi:hypothetical protein